MKTSTGREKLIWIVCVVCTAVYFGACVYLFYNQTQYPTTGRFESDLPFHISMAVDDRWYYSFTAFVYVWLYSFKIHDILIGIFLAAVTIATIFVTYRIVTKLARKYEMQISKPICYALAMILNFVMAFYVPVVNHAHYIGYQSGNLWHNSTYLCMRLFGLLTISGFIDLVDKYKEGLKAGEWLVLSILMAVTTGIKPSFLLVFAPAVCICLVVDLINHAKLSKVIIAALTVVPSVAIILWQNIVLFGNDTGNGFEINPFYTLSQRSEHAKVAVIISVLFPLLILIWHIRDFYKDKLYLGGIFVWLFGFAEVFLLSETGARSKDGNFLWGYSIAIFVWFVVSVVRWVRDLKAISVTHKKVSIVYATLTGLVLAWQTVCGVYYFCLLLTGVTYFA